MVTCSNVPAVIVVTGASGFIGTALVRRLAGDGAQVIGVDRRPARSGDTGHHTVDLAAPLPHGVRRLLASADVVVHLAGRPGARDHSPAIALARHRDNVVTTRPVLAAAGGPVVVASSSSVYGGAAAGHSCREDDPPRPRGGYARSKWRAEAECAARRRGGGEVCIVRPFTVIGPGQRPDMAVARWIGAAVAGTPIEVFGSLTRTRDVTDVRGVARALADLVALAAAGRSLPPVLNVGTGRARSLGEIVDAVRRATRSRSDVLVVPGAKDEPDNTLADTRRCAATLGYVPVTDLDEVVAEQLASVLATA